MGEFHISSKARTHYLQKGKIRTRKKLRGILEWITPATLIMSIAGNVFFYLAGPDAVVLVSQGC